MVFFALGYRSARSAHSASTYSLHWATCPVHRWKK